jgi:hypothetical protein
MTFLVLESKSDDLLEEAVEYELTVVDSGSQHANLVRQHT